MDRFGAHVRIVEWKGRQVVAKIARFEIEVYHVENETRVFEKVEKDKIQHPDLPAISPTFLGHLTDNGRVMGMFIEKLQGRRACLQDLSARFHKLGIVHGNVNRHNFVVDDESRRVHLIDFQNAKDLTHVKANEEIDSLKDQLVEDTERGGEVAASD